METPALALFRRGLIAAIVVLVVARPCIPFEDPGLLIPESSSAPLILPLLWLLVLMGWAIYRFLLGRSSWYGGLPAASLALVALVLGLSATWSASYRHPAWLIAWEWVAAAAAFFVVRQLIRSSLEARCLLAAFMATGLCLATQSLLERAFPGPSRAPLGELQGEHWARFRCLVLGASPPAPTPFPATIPWGALALATQDEDPTTAQVIPLRHQPRIETTEPALPLSLRPHLPGPPLASFTNPLGFAGFLVLLLPLFLTAALTSGQNLWLRLLTISGSVGIVLALLATQVREYLIPPLLISAAGLVLASRLGLVSLSSRRNLFLALGFVTLCLGTAFLVAVGVTNILETRGDVWRSTLTLIGNSGPLGIGPGNYTRHFPAVMTPTSQEMAVSPGNTLLELACAGGILAVGAWIVFILATLTGFRALPQPEEASSENEEPGAEIHAAGLMGLLVGLVLRLVVLPPEQMPYEGLAAGVRSLVWFVLFAILVRAHRTPGPRLLACLGSVAASTFCLLFGGETSVPGLLEPLVVLAAVATNQTHEGDVPIRRGSSWLGRFLPIPACGALALAYTMQILLPVTTAHQARTRAMALAQYYLDVRGGVTPSEEAKAPVIREPGRVLARIVEELRTGVEADPTDARLWVDLANWEGQLQVAFPANPNYLKRALLAARAAQERDPRGVDGFLAEATLLEQAGRPRRGPDSELRSGYLSTAPTKLLEALTFHPVDTRLRFRAAESLRRSGDLKLARWHAEKTLELDALAPTPERQLTDFQRKRLQAQWQSPEPRRGDSLE